MTRFVLTFVTSLFLVVAMNSAAAAGATDGSGSPFQDDDREVDSIDRGAEARDDAVQIGLEAGQDGTPGVEPVVDSGSTSGPAAEPEGFWIGWTMIDNTRTPPCVRRAGELLDVPTRAEADQVAATREAAAIEAYESVISAGNPPPLPCPGEDPDLVPGIDATPAARWADEAIERLPVAAPTISGGYAITGLRSWYDLGRDPTFTATETFDLGPVTTTATLTATATARIDVGDDTPTFTTTARGGGYHDGEPGPDDIVHTYIDRAELVSFTATDTWQITVTFDSSLLAPINLTHTMEPVTLDYPVREVRSVRDR